MNEHDGTVYNRGTIRLREIAVNERPQERLEKFGASSLSDTELLAMLLRSGSRNLDVLGLSQRLITEAGSLAGLLTWQAEDFRRLPGIGHVKSLQLITVMEVARRVLREQREAVEFNSAEAVYEFMYPVTAGLEVEKFWTLCLNRKNRLLRLVEVTSGTASSSLAHPREVYREAIRLGASAIICVHNHPSGDPSPSAADIKVTRALKKASETLDIPMLDHVIAGIQHKNSAASGYYSFGESGLI